jgi:uncharacterized protein YciI
MKSSIVLVCIVVWSATVIAGDVGPGGYEMTTYYVAFLYRGPKWTPQDTAETKKIQEEHMANIQQMARDGKLVLAGPFTDNGELRGIFVFQGISADEAQQLAANDPAVKAGRLRMEMHPWYAAKGIHVDPPVTREKP